MTPAAIDPHTHPAVRAKEPAQKPEYRVLSIEDNPDDARMVQTMLVRAGPGRFQVENVDRVEKALERLATETFDALIVDLGLPDSQGLETFARVHAASPIPAIVLTGQDDQRMALDTLRAGAHEYLVKTEVRAELLAQVVLQSIATHQAVEAAKASDLRYRRLFEAAQDGILILDANGTVVDANPYLLSLLGYGFAEVAGMKLWELGPFRDLAPSREAFEEIKKQEYIRYDDLPLQARDGQLVTVEFEFVSYPVEGQTIIQCNIRDISSRRESSMALRASEAKYRRLVETSHDLIWEVDTAGTLTFINEASRAIFGLEPVEVIGRNFLELIPPRYHQKESGTFADKIQTGRENLEDENQVLRKDGRIITLHTNSRSVLDESGQVVGIAGASHDITLLKVAEHELRASEQKYRRLFEAASVGIWSINADRRVTFANRRMAEILDYPQEEVLHARVETFLDENARVLVERKLKEREKGISEVYEVQLKRRDGSLIWISMATTPLFDDHGVYDGAMAMVTDVTALRHARDEQRLLSACLEQAAEAVLVSSLDGVIEYVNPAFTTMTGYSREEALGQNAQILHSDESAYKGICRTVLRGEVWSGRLIKRRKDGQEYEEAMTVSPVRDSEGAIAKFVALKRDVTAQVSMEKRIEQGERVATLGRVAATMAHEFNNVLMSILPFAEVVEREGVASEKLALCAHHILNAVSRGREVTSEVLRFTNPLPPSLQPIDLLEWLPDLKSELSAVLPSQYVIDLRLPPGSLVILGDREQLGQVFVNLAMNARDAMPSGGRLEISAAPGGKDDEYARAHVPDHARFVHLCLKDHGIGIPPETLARIFEPLFTTKRSGTGIGLGVVHQTITLHGGVIRVESEPGAGTTFHLFLPRGGEGHELIDTASLGIPGGSLKQRRILLVEDEPSVAAGTGANLEAEGATVRIEVEGGRVLEVIREFAPHAVILDVMLPDADGRVLQKEIALLFPTLPVILSSGVIDTRSKPSAGFLAFLQKPYSSEDLRNLLCDMIGPC